MKLLPSLAVSVSLLFLLTLSLKAESLEELEQRYAANAAAAPPKILVWEAHRGGGGGYEMPESCPVSFEYGWMLGGVPEADAATTKDGVMISLHDPTLKRTSVAPEPIASTPISELTYEEIRKYNIGGEEYPDQRVPAVNELLAKLAEDPEKELIFDYKNVPIELLADAIRKYDVASQVTFSTCDPAKALEMKKELPEIQVKLWIGGSAEAIMKAFKEAERNNFYGFEQVQLHLNDLTERDAENWRWQLSKKDLKYALDATLREDVLLQVLPWRFEAEDIDAVLDLGIRSFAVDYPNKFCKITSAYFSRHWAQLPEEQQQ